MSYAAVAPWDVSTRQTSEGSIRRTIKNQDRWLAIDPDTCPLIAPYLDEIRAGLAAVGVELRADAYLFSNDPAYSRPWNPDWATHKVAEAADAAGVKLDIKGGRHYTASQLLAGSFDLRNTAARLGHSGGGATTGLYFFRVHLGALLPPVPHPNEPVRSHHATSRLLRPDSTCSGSCCSFGRGRRHPSPARRARRGAAASAMTDS